MKIIAGMHRSGTSLVARLLFEGGADFGEASGFYRADKWNPDGYFEQISIHEINIPLINGIFWKFSYFFLPSERTIRRRALRRSEEIRSVSKMYEGKIVKENRFCLTLPAWIQEGAKVQRVLFVVREPQAVARSIRRRNWITMAKAYSLWTKHNRRLLDTIREYELPVHFIRYENLLDPSLQVPELGSAASFMGLELSSSETQRLLSEVVKVKNFTGTPATDYPRQVERLWRTLRNHHSRQSVQD